MRACPAETARVLVDRRRPRTSVPEGFVAIRANQKDLGLGFWACVETAKERTFFRDDEPGVALDRAHRHARDLGLRVSRAA